MTDHIRIDGIEVFGHHGAMAEERASGQMFVIDVDLSVDLSIPGHSDSLQDTVDYSRLAGAIHQLVADEQWTLIERVAERVAELALEDGRVTSVDVTVHKPEAPIDVSFGDVSVKLHRSQ